MALTSLACPRCGGPLPPGAARRPTRCPFCRATVLAMPDLVDAERFRAAFKVLDEELAELALVGRRSHIEGVPYRLFGICGVGETSEVWVARRDRRITEEVVIKVPRDAAGGSRLTAEHGVLRDLAASDAPGAGRRSRLVPAAIGIGPLSDERGGATGSAPALVLRRPSGFVHTLADVAVEHPEGLDPRHGVWLWRRLLEVLAVVHAAGWAHGAVRPEHVLVHARDHGARLVGFGSATRAEPYDLATALDLAGAAAAVRGVVRTAEVPEQLAALLARTADPASSQADALALHEQVGQAARAAYGPPRYIPLALSGWH